MNKLILSLFPGIDLLGRAFDSSFCVVRGPDIITGGDIRSFNPPKNVFGGIIGGPPCQDFSLLNRNPGNYSAAMLIEYQRVVSECNADWFLYENVATAPSPVIPGYTTQRFPLDLGWFTEFSRLRHFVFGSKSGKLLNPLSKSNRFEKKSGGAVTSGDKRSFRACCDIQGLPNSFDLTSFTLTGKKKAVANGVPIALGLYLAQLILKEIYNEKTNSIEETPRLVRRCKCPCKKIVTGRATYFNNSCRKRAQRARDKSSQT